MQIAKIAIRSESLSSVHYRYIFIINTPSPQAPHSEWMFLAKSINPNATRQKQALLCEHTLTWT